MDKFLVKGGQALSGSVRISGAKNAALPIMAASLLVSGPVELTNIPALRDVTTMMKLLESHGANVLKNKDESIIIDTSTVTNCCAPYELVRTMRASIVVLGPLLSRYGHAEVSLPGGCAIGSRPVNLHVDGLRALGATIEVSNGYIRASVEGRLKGAEIELPSVTVTGTENLLMAAVLAQGRTIIRNAAQEPEVTDLAKFLIKMGAKISGLETDTLVIDGVKTLHGGQYVVMPDRIEAGTFLVAAAATRGSVTLHGVLPSTMCAVLDKLEEAGAYLSKDSDTIYLDMKGQQPKAVDLETAPYPLMPTDMQAQFMAMNVLAKGRSTIVENVFENRFMHVAELQRMGAIIEFNSHQAFCEGKDRLTGAPVMATDLRASAGLVIASLMADGETHIHRIYHIDRGYDRIEEKLSQLGACIERIE